MAPTQTLCEDDLGVAFSCDKPQFAKAPSDIPNDILLLVFEQCDYQTLSSIGLTCRAFRQLSLPCLLRDVDISSHNNGRIPEEDDDVTPRVCADHNARYRPDSLVPRQRAFLRLIINRPQLAMYVQSFTWTLIWEGLEDDENLDPTELETWNVFSRMTNVTHLDLGSLHEIWYMPFARQNPSRLFPAVTTLRLLGWMHRGLVKAILTSLNLRRLLRLDLDCLQDEGEQADGSPIGCEFVTNLTSQYHDMEDLTVIDDDLYERQQAGGVFTFPGPNWYALRLLSTFQLERLENVRIRLTPLNSQSDVRNIHTMFRETAALVLKLQPTLKSLTIILGEAKWLYEIPKPTGCGTGRLAMLQRRREYIVWAIRKAAYFLKQMAVALSTGKFPLLKRIRFEGFHHIVMAEEPQASGADLVDLRDSLQIACRNLAMDVDFTGTPYPDYRFPEWHGYDFDGGMEGDLSYLLSRS